MVNPKLLDYIKSQLALNVGRENIKKSLLDGGGWSESDIDRAFARINKPPVNIWTLLIGAIAYSLISSFAFVITSGGWSALIFGYIWSIIFGIFCLLVFFISVYRQLKHVSKVSVKTKAFVLVLAFQFLALLTNRGDCGDEAGSYSFIDRVMGNDLCGTSSPSLFGSLFLFFALAYIASLIYFLFSIRTSLSDAKPSKALVYIVLCLLLIAIGIRAPSYMETRASIAALEVQQTNDDLTRQAESSGDPRICEKIEEAVISNMPDLVSQKDICYETLAEKLDDLSLCDKIKNTLPYYGTASDCRDYIWYARALAKKDISLCDNIVGQQKKFCLSDDDFIAP